MTQTTTAPAVTPRRVVALIPAFDEAATIARVIAGVRSAVPGIDVVVIDDGSGDDTAVEAVGAGARVVRLPFNLGYGAALQTGYKLALREGYDAIVQLDGDGQHEPADIPALLDAVTGDAANVALGSRFIGAATYRPELARRVGMRLFRTLAWLIGGVTCSDVTSGFQALDRDVVRFFAADRYPRDYPDADVLLMLRRSGFRVVDIPVRMYRKATGTASMHAGLRPAFYVFKMLLSLVVTALRREPVQRRST